MRVILFLILFMMTCNEPLQKKEIEETCIMGFVTEIPGTIDTMRIEGKLINCNDLDK